ncbi:MAG: hypothetical protein ACU0A6_07455 [Shimia sp.]|uniref:hypothetical protein n=1 Tax=Shimia sp. TaxID=1954381 RepID=UPI00405A2DE3
MDVIGFGFSAFLAHVLTNIDNLAIMSGLILTVGVWRTTVGYLVAQAILLCVAAVVAEGLESGVPNVVGYLGLCLFSLGWRLWRGNGAAARTAAAALDKQTYWLLWLCF